MNGAGPLPDGVSARIKKARVGKIDCFEHHSLVGLLPEDAEKVLKNARCAGVKIHPDDREEISSSPAAGKKRSRKGQDAPPSDAPASGLRNWVESLVPDAPRGKKQRPR